MPKFLLDANLSPETAEYLRSLGYQAESIQEQGLGNLTDEQVVQKAINEGSVIVTFDRDFSQSWYLSYQGKISIVWLRLKKQTVEHVNVVLGDILEQVTEEEFKETLIAIGEEEYKLIRW
ncbi:MAG: hypothetical protein UX80_C0005G0005 [Candidatus Amesbacteria bacterium GW2011_GWA2_47_11b]|uniref:DUF5615 domain-containing protein n=3 Tax=Candidatus Amesiibacteriota TaxID=1752730 RepID=A0A0G1SHR0_9BACT|nr:MAG: hypothetical protein UX42_C0001G0062 [Microgenomates group bacterium GW2011_GWC1_46_20]KKU58185.1 MAG: hypothetical protein UX80_C0005G0005 [Candidatus Amesbacteria bacterium GW2011_GWA2_47_11b]KKU68979.1 MAG: hypothetical protein UX92_C0016G0004 [Candidatus Amesbacteria bacterium GW2011_GWA1_47_20]KKU84831.1 MAG: hypothetical protein UY11_C0003G0042 [Candidatus Amesbacteria bacterium GW2011_GWC2_47_8]